MRFERGLSAPPLNRSAYNGRPRRRGMALLLTLALHIIAFTILLLQKAAPIPVKMENSLKGFMLMPEAKDEAGGDAPDASKKADREVQQKGKETETKPLPPTPEPPQPNEPAPTEPKKSYFIQMSRNDFAASNIGAMASSRPAGGGAQADSQAAYGPGSGPGGAVLYNADWFRKPSDTELGGYLPANRPRTGWGEIACKTVPRNRVEDCISLAESPPGSGFARAVREAAWQFQITPPRINGKPQIGAWVRIHIDYTASERAP